MQVCPLQALTSNFSAIGPLQEIIALNVWPHYWQHTTVSLHPNFNIKGHIMYEITSNEMNWFV